MHQISPDHLSLDQVDHLLRNKTPLSLSDTAQTRLNNCRQFLDNTISRTERPVYGINTGFGSLCDVSISDENLEKLQENLVMSHAVGTGELVPQEVIRIMMLLKIQSLSYGHSGVRVEVVQRLVDMYNADILPVIFELGSLGASGDLAPLAHLSLPLIGMGEVWHQGRRQRADVVLKALGWAPLTFKAKEALALLNGTQFSGAYAVWSWLEGARLAQQADFNTAISFEAFNCQLEPLDERIHNIRPHAGQIFVARNVLGFLKGGELGQIKNSSVQDPYAFRCVPQVHGASRNALQHIGDMITTEMNSTTDNPLIFPESNGILSGGNFHAQPLALPLDYLAIALAELGNISERRLYQLISGQRDLPAFLIQDAGLNSGLMIAQYTAASIVSQNKMYCTPASTDSIVSCNGKEDHVSMAANAGTKARRVVLNLERLLAIEFMAGMQGLEFRKPRRFSALIEKAYSEYRQVVPALVTDRILSEDIDKTIHFLRHFKIANVQ